MKIEARENKIAVDGGMYPRPPQHVIFDCDGVLVDSEPLANACLREALAGQGLVLDVAEVRRRYVGLSMASMMSAVETELGRALPDGWLDVLQADTFRTLREHVKPVPHVRAAVEAIVEKGVRVSVASSGSLKKVTLTLGTTGLLGLFNPRLLSAEQVKRGKPFPDLFEAAARLAGIVPQNTVVVEDSLPGVEAAVAAHIRVFGYAGDPMTDRVALQAAGAVVFDDMRKLPALLGLA
jgi:HAD superfamily hydrolase (TIGR01509 family)